MNKQTILVSGPFDTKSGYGRKALDIVRSLVKLKQNEANFQFISLRWGNCSFGLMNENDKYIKDNLIHQPTFQPDVYIHIGIPNEFQPIGKYNILFTSGIETTACDASWIEGCNRANLVVVPSQHAKQIFENTKFEKLDQNTKKPIGTVELKTKIEVIFEGADTNIYKKLDILPSNEDIVDILNNIDEDFVFEFTGAFLQGEIGEDRKNVSGLIKTFLETFKGTQKLKPALLLKTHGASPSILDREEILSKIDNIKNIIGNQDLPNIYILHGDLTDEEMNIMYNHPKIKAHISFTKGEGFGRPLLEASISAKPVIVSNWSGHIDFLPHAIKLGGNLTQVHPSAVVPNMILAESGWFTIDYNEASKILKEFYKNYDKFLGEAKKQSYFSKTNFSLEKMEDKLREVLDNNIPKYKPFIMPNLSNPIKLPTLKQIN